MSEKKAEIKVYSSHKAKEKDLKSGKRISLSEFFINLLKKLHLYKEKPLVKAETVSVEEKKPKAFKPIEPIEGLLEKPKTVKKAKKKKAKVKKAKKLRKAREKAVVIVPEKLPKVKVPKATRRGWFGEREKHREIALRAWRKRYKKKLEEMKKRLDELELQLKKGKDIEENVKAIRKKIEKIKIEKPSMAKVVEKEIAKENIPPIQIILGKIETEKNVNERIERVKQLIKRLDFEYFKRHITESEYKKRLLEYQQELRELEAIAREKGKKASVKPSKLRAPKFTRGFQIVGDASQLISGAGATVSFPEARIRKEGETIAKPFPAVKKAPKKTVRPPIPPAKKRRLSKIEQMLTFEPEKPSARVIKPTPAREAVEMIASKGIVKEKVSQEKIAEIEKKIEKLMEKYKLSEKDIEKDIDSLNKEKIIRDFDKLINLIELQHKTREDLGRGVVREIVREKPIIKEVTKEKPTVIKEVVREAPVETIYKTVEKGYSGPIKRIYRGPTPSESFEALGAVAGLTVTTQKAEKVKGVEKEITKQKIVTDFDRVLAFVREQGETSTDHVMKELNIDRKKLNEVAEILEENGLIKIEYPPIGSVKLVDVNYVKPKKREKEKKTKVEKPAKKPEPEKRKKEKKGFGFLFKAKPKKEKNKLLGD